MRSSPVAPVITGKIPTRKRSTSPARSRDQAPAADLDALRRELAGAATPVERTGIEADAARALQVRARLEESRQQAEERRAARRRALRLVGTSERMPEEAELRPGGEFFSALCAVALRTVGPRAAVAALVGDPLSPGR